jgi:hypothetical protein
MPALLPHLKRLQAIPVAPALAAAVFADVAGVSRCSAQGMELISATATWDYLHPTDGVDPATLDPDGDFAVTWHGYSDYDGPAFVTGSPAPFSYGGINFFTTAGLTGTMIGNPDFGIRFSAYFKKEITTTRDFTDVTVRMLADDGAVIYLDGVEIRRVNMSSASGDSYLLMSDVNGDENALIPDFSIGALAAGTHVFAVSLHNANLTSTDLGLLFQLFGTGPPLPPAPVMLRTDFAGVFTDVLAASGLAETGWEKDSPPYSFTMAGGGNSTLDSAPIDLSAAAGDVYFTAQLFIHETDKTSNFEADDSFSVKLEVTTDNNVVSEVSLLPGNFDANLDGRLTGDEMNAAAASAQESAFVALQLFAMIPASNRSVRVLIAGANDSPSEEFAIGGMLFSDILPGSDADGDGMAREAEMFARTDPADSASVLTLSALTHFFNETTQAFDYTLTHPAVAGSRYAIEATTDGQQWRLIALNRPVGNNPNRALGFSIPGTETSGRRLLVRLRAIP